MNAIDRAIAGATPIRSAAMAWGEALAATAAIETQPHRLLADIIAEQAGLTPDAPALLSDRESFTFGQLDDRARRWAAWAMAQGLKPGDCVALLMSNRPEYVAIWLGLTSAGVVVALINTSLTGRSLEHCISVASPLHVIAEEPFVAAATTACEVPVSPHHLIDLEAIAPASSRPPVTIGDRALLIYTSGTTGLPKAAHVSHRRILNWALWFKGLLGNTPADRMYDCLPLFHSVGGIVAVAATLVAGGSTVIAPKFSASRFWADINRWGCTQAQYIGELCRFLLNAPPSEDEARHALRLLVGNGMRADVWEGFKSRFAIPQIVEFYAATEGSFSLFNVEGKPGAIGKVPAFLRHRFPIAILRHDHETGEPMRGEDGLCIKAGSGEAGEAIGRIGSGDGAGRFEGYTDAKDSERKILRNVFKPGDAWFRTGDLMKLDAAGYYSFVDRIGDTFRWKGENVSTLEVANVLAALPGVTDAVVYGVEVPGHDGRAGMASLTVTESFSPADVAARAAAELPAYAVPVFLRITSAMALTDTFKHRKSDLQREGFNPLTSEDEFLVRVDGAYLPLDVARHAAVCAGALRL